MVTPFGLANAPSTFQKYINWVLRDYLDEFCSAYIDDILIYSGNSRKEHREHVRKVLQRLRDAGLQIDIDKCEFEVQTTKYLGFIVEAGNGVRMDPEKVKAIIEWKAPTSVKGVQSFLGFANFYRRFIKDFSNITLPLHALVRKDTPFGWTKEAETAFGKLKQIFTTAPVLAQFDHERETIIETDSSGWVVGGTLLQVDESGALRPCAFFSKKNSPAECNYEIYDKEMLAIVRCLEEWDAELRSVPSFQIRTDHKNLEYFMTVRKLTERQMRWSLILSRYNFTIAYLLGKLNIRADALSRRE
jgi:RNase H-like domain found in reverse transcriptase/Reverse transcriptase (RNA-dependent DNA polymerase)